ncbi:Piwi-domain-containing protein [Clavulina sp. PMI_390]|nr:Piwi-domain-containing protein [Clavulina sp. PMI_390]
MAAPTGPPPIMRRQAVSSRSSQSMPRSGKPVSGVRELTGLPLRWQVIWILIDKNAKSSLFGYAIWLLTVLASTNTVSIGLPKGRTNKNITDSKGPAPTQSDKPAAPPRPVPRRFLESVLGHFMHRAHPELFPGSGYFDGRSILYLFNAQNIKQGGTWKFTMGEEGEEYSVTLTYTRAESFKPIFDLLNGIPNANEVTESDQFVSALQAVFRQGALTTSTFVATKRAVFPYDREFSHNNYPTLAPGIALLKGLFMSVRPVIGRLVVNIDVSNLVVEYLGRNDSIDDAPLDRGAENILKAALRRIQVCHSPRHPLYKKGLTAGQPKRFKIIGFSRSGADRLWLEKDGQQITVAVRRTMLQYPRAVCAHIEGRKATDPKNPPPPIYIPLELLDIAPGQVYKSTLSPAAATEMIHQTTSSPPNRLRAIQEKLRGLNLNNKSALMNAGTSINYEPLQIQSARMLDPRSLIFGENRGEQARGGSWSWHSSGGGRQMPKRYARPAVIKGWGVVNFDPTIRYTPERDEAPGARPHPLMEFAMGLKVTLNARATGGQPIIHAPARGFNGSTVYEELRAAVRKVQQAQKYPCGDADILLVCVLDLPSDDIRAKVKAWSDVGTGIATQIVVGSKIKKGSNSKADGSYLNNLSLKINAKLGGSNQLIHNKGLAAVPAVIVGADVSHPSPGAFGPSVAAVTCSVGGGDYARYRAKAHVQPPRQEIIQDFARHVYSLLADGVGHIIIFRDGVSESQFQAVFDNELGSLIGYLTKKFDREAQKPRPKVTYVVVGKRHHIRFFPSNSHDPSVDSRSQNFLPGLVVDQEVVHPVWNDFYLQSQKPIQGTSRPGHYTVLWDENRIPQSDLQEMIFDLCHIQSRATTAVSIPAPVAYAHLACSRARLHLRDSLYGPDGTLTEDSTGSAVITDKQLAEWNALVATHHIAAKLDVTRSS